MSNPITVQDMAEAWRIHEQTILSAIHDGRLPATKVGEARRSTYYISPEDAEAYAAQHRPRDKGDQAVKALIGLLAEHGLERICEAVNSPPIQLEQGWDLSAWMWQQIPGAVLFVRVVHLEHDTDPAKERAIMTSEPRLMVINGSVSERAKWQAIADAGDAPCMVVMAPGGRIPLARRDT